VSAPLSPYLDQGLTQAGSRYDTANPVVLNQQVPSGSPQSSDYTIISNGLQPSPSISTQLHHFPDSVYDLSPESHISRLVGAVLGDASMGLISKMYTQARMSDYLLTTHFSDLDRMFGDIFGVHRFQAEALTFNPYVDQATPEAWADLFSRDAAYRNRIEQFARGINMGGTVQGMETVAEAILGCPVQVYETWTFVDQFSTSPGGLSAANIGANYYGSIEAQQEHYSDLERQTYSDVEGGVGAYGRTTSSNRGEFIVRPMRAISLEENYQLIRVLTRLKPAEALLTISSEGVALHKRVAMRSVDADSINWIIKRAVTPVPDKVTSYVPPVAVVTEPTITIKNPGGDYLPNIENTLGVFSSFGGHSSTLAGIIPTTFMGYGVFGVYQSSNWYHTSHLVAVEAYAQAQYQPVDFSTGKRLSSANYESLGQHSDFPQSGSASYPNILINGLGVATFVTVQDASGAITPYIVQDYYNASDYSTDMEQIQVNPGFIDAYSYPGNDPGWAGAAIPQYKRTPRYPSLAVAVSVHTNAGRVASSGVMQSPPYLSDRNAVVTQTSAFRETGA
jgi:hypothetical protein